LNIFILQVSTGICSSHSGEFCICACSKYGCSIIQIAFALSDLQYISLFIESPTQPALIPCPEEDEKELKEVLDKIKDRFKKF
jgi:hypothetical protein